MADRKCVLCEGRMEEGFVLVDDHDSRRHQEWHAGVPTTSILKTLKKSQKRLKITSLRCTQCGYLMEFAPGEGSD